MAHDFHIPKHKRLTGKARDIEQSRRAVLEFAKMVQKDRLLLLSIVTGGPEHWRKVAAQAFRGFMIDQQLLDSVFLAMVEWAGPDPVTQYDALQRADLVALKLDRLKGLARFIEDEAHMDRVLDHWVPNTDERAAIRSQLLRYVRAEGVH
jgi:hypothetical protein